ncbi:putative S-adenosyl-L-methionine-dependent methyltransferase [Rosa chinensis]|uniref:Methyltransferase n=1 Tax=Rosa chinensis TaxID=74649 RepID=A0A2P6SGM3_ROSCH|nr:probable methyltransferase PMT15 [Rosa chinensis]PRQ57823.1 putative S-adenosyl-L-methionine-dependent methyltransferase [Rosa chinensis]
MAKFSLKPKRTNLYFLTLATVLCTLCYLIGVWQHSSWTPSSTAATASITSAVPCPQFSKNITTHLDFEPHHRAEDLSIPPATARVTHVPPCEASLSEYTPCEDASRSLKFDRDRLIYRERHCPEKQELLKCRIPAPHGYTVPFRWPESRYAVWYANVPHKELTVEKKNQNWVHYQGDRFRFPGGGTMFPNGADAYIDDIGKLINLRDGSIRTAIDTGCGVASWGAYLLSRDILTVSFAPRDTHEAQVQFALERGVPAVIGVMASIRLPYPSRAFDMAHCSRCLIPWGQYDGLYLIEVDRVLRPGGYWILSGPPINWQNHWKGWQRTEADLKAEQDMIERVAKSLCWKKLKQKGDLAIWQKPTNHIHCQANRKVLKKPSFCQAQNPDTAWYTKLEECLTPLPGANNIKEVAGGELAKWPARLTTVPPRISSGSLKGITAEMFRENTALWKQRVAHYKTLDYQLADPGRYRNLLDMNSYLGSFAAALADDPAWVMNIVPVEAEVNTLGAIYERGLIGTYQNWCEAMSTYPRTYDFIHSDSVFTLYKDRCEMEDILLEMDRILRPQGSIIFRDDVDLVLKAKALLDAMQYDARIVDHEKSPHHREKILLAAKQYWTAPAPNHKGESSKES